MITIYQNTESSIEIIDRPTNGCWLNIVSIPTLIASPYGMNVGLPLQGSPWAFLFIVGVAVAVCLFVTIVFWRRDWL